MTPEAIRVALEAAVVAWCQSATNGDPCPWPKCVCHTDRYDLDMAAAVAAFLRALPEREKASWEYDPATRQRVPTNATIPVRIAPHRLADIVDAAVKERA